MTSLFMVDSLVRRFRSQTHNSALLHAEENARRWWWLPDAAVAALLLTLCCLFFQRALLHPTHIVDFNDTVKVYYPWRHFAGIPTRGGQPLWLPYTNGGEPLAANPQASLFYPLDIGLHAVFETHLALGYGFVLHIFLAGFFVYLLARHLIGDRLCSFVSAAVFMFSEYLITQAYAGHYSSIAAAAWLPLAFLLCKLAVDKVSPLYTLLAAIPIGLQLLAGHVQTSFLTLILVGLYALLRAARIISTVRNYGRAFVLFLLPAAAFVAGVGLSAVQLLPTYEFHRQSVRAGGVSFWFATVYSLPFHSLVGLFLPNLFGTPLDESYLNAGPYWEFALYLGALPPIVIFLLLFLRKMNELTLFLLGVACLSLLLALGSNTPLYWPLWKFVPGFDAFRVPARFLLLFSVSAALLTGVGLKALRDELTSNDARRLRTVIKVLFILALILSSAVLVAHLAREPLLGAGEALLRQKYLSLDDARHPYEWYAGRLRPAYMSALVDALALVPLIFVSALLLSWRLKATKASPRFLIVAAAFMVANLWFYHHDFVRTRRTADVYGESSLVSFLKGNAGHYRVHDKDFILRHNLGVVHGLYTLQGYNPMLLSNFQSVIDALQKSPLNDNQGALNVLNVKYVLSKTPIELTWLKQVFWDGDAFVYENTNVLPKAFVVPDAEVSLYGRLTDEGVRMNVGGQALVEGVRFTSYTPNEVCLEANLRRAGVLVLSEIYYPGWRADVNGREEEILQVFGLLRGVPLKEGKQRVTFVFEPHSLRLGMLITALTMGIVFISLGAIAAFRLYKRGAAAGFYKRKNHLMQGE